MTNAYEAAEETGLAELIGRERAARFLTALQRAEDESVLRAASREDLNAAVIMLGVGGRSAGNLPAAGPRTARASAIVRALTAQARADVPEGDAVLAQASFARALVSASIAAGVAPADFTGWAGPVRFERGRPLPGAAALGPDAAAPGMVMVADGRPETWGEFKARAVAALSTRLAPPRRTRAKRSRRAP